MAKRRALITGITGQDGSYLAEFLLAKEYEVYGVVRRSATGSLRNIEHLVDQLTLIPGDLSDLASLTHAVELSAPDEIYNLAAQSCVQESWRIAHSTCDITGMGLLRIIEAARLLAPNARIYQASSSEMFGDTAGNPQNESTPFGPSSPYGAAKVFAHHLAVNYRESFGMYICCGILFNHESPRRGLDFVTNKIASAVARIRQGQATSVALGNIDARRDWGFAGDYVRAMWQMLQQEEPDDFVIGTGRAHSVAEFAELAFARAGLDWRDHVRVSDGLRRPKDIRLLVADASRAHEQLGWYPAMSFPSLVQEMVDAHFCGETSGNNKTMVLTSPYLPSANKQPFSPTITRSCGQSDHDFEVLRNSR